MLTNYLKIAFRNLAKRKAFSFINIAGLALGIACCLLIALWVRDETGYDRFQRDAAVTYRVNWDFDWNGNAGVGPGTPPPLAARFAQEIPEVTAATRLYPVSHTVVRHGEAFFDERHIVAADSNFFGFFSFKLLVGDPRTALAMPNSVVLTETAARKYFGDAPALGQVLTLGEAKLVFGRHPYDPAFRVTGIMQEPSNSHIQFDMLTSMASHPEVAHFDWSWVWMQVATYVKLRAGASLPAVQTKVTAVVREYGSPAFERVGFSYDELVASGGHFAFVLQPMGDVYLGSAAIGNRVGLVGNRVYVLLFSTVAAFILLIACINFTNLATAQATTRAREVGIRKALGSNRSTLAGRFLVESLVFSALALPLALGLVAVCIGPFNQVSGKALRFDLFQPAWLPVALAGITVLVGLLAGSYPGFYLSSFQPIQALRGAFRPGGKSRHLRHGLVVFQFVTTIGLIACTLVVRQQMTFLRTADLGFDRDGVVVISNENDRLHGQAEAFKERLKERPDILAASLSTGVPPDGGFEDSYTAEGRGDAQRALISYMTDEDFLSTLDIELVQGRGFSRDYAADAAGVIVNEAAVRAFGWENPVGRAITYPGGDNAEYEVIGVVKDFNFATLHAPVTPFALFHNASQSYDISDSYVVVRVSGTELDRSLRLLKAEWEAFAPDTPFEYTFLDERLGAQYEAEQRLGRMFLAFSGLAILIGCMGLLGLAAFTAEQRTKEVGVRKVLGASVPSLVALLSKDFLQLVGIAFVVAVPLAYLAMRDWLAGFAYHTDLGVGVFLLAGVLALAVALLTVSTQALRAATADPVQSLRYE